MGTHTDIKCEDVHGKIKGTVFVYIQINCEVVKRRCTGSERQYMFIYN